MSAFRMIRLGSIAPITLLALFPSLAQAQATEDDTLPPAVDAAPALADPAPVAAPAAAVAAPAPAAAAEKAAAPANASDDAAADAAAAAAAEQAATPGPSNEEVDQFKLNLYGFTDFTYSTQIGNSFDLGSPYSSFAVGKLNLYAAAELGDNWRSLAEIRFMYLPNGTTPASTTFPAPPRTDTTVSDYTDLNRPVKWGGVSIQRAWLEHTFHPAVTVRAGMFLTPYGIWNVDHGSPVIIGARRPFVIGESLFPEAQTGLEIYGAWNFGPSQVGYHLTLSNGRGPIDTYQDLDHNKAIGGRLFFKHEHEKFGAITIGTSGYKGTYTDSTDSYASDPISGKLTVTHPITAQYKELSLAADLKWELGGALVQSEIIVNDRAYPDDHRPPMYSTSGPPGFAPDHRRVGIYGLAGYRFPFLGIMPFFGAEHYDVGLYSFTPASSAIWGGLNVRPTARVVLKAQYTYSWFSKWSGPDYGHYNGIDLQAAWSF